MGISPSYPAVRRVPMRFVDSSHFGSTGKRIFDPSTEEGRTRNRDMMEMGFASVLNERTAAEKAKEDYENLTLEDLRGDYPGLTHEGLLDLKAEFQNFDTKQDGVLDFYELSEVLDRMGDSSTPEERKVAFQAVIHGSTEMTESISFRQYVAVLASGSAIWRRWSEASEASIRRLKLSIIQQLHQDVF